MSQEKVFPIEKYVKRNKSVRFFDRTGIIISIILAAYIVLMLLGFR